MSHRIHTPEFKDEAVRQVVERGYTVKEVAQRLGISEDNRRSWHRIGWSESSRWTGRTRRG
ncbi:transposase [Gaopeijia maritima]|uniref:transposase n=1 Tax=Gaopeijia maritima TaxID=3119007 RepID=UPI003864B437